MLATNGEHLCLTPKFLQQNRFVVCAARDLCTIKQLAPVNGGHTCLQCKTPVHAICDANFGTAGGVEGHGSKILCLSCARGLSFSKLPFVFVFILGFCIPGVVGATVYGGHTFSYKTQVQEKKYCPTSTCKFY